MEGNEPASKGVSTPQSGKKTSCHINGKVSETKGAVMYSGVDESGRPVIVKTLKTGLPGPAELARFKYEVDLIKNAPIEGIIRTYDILYDQDTISLIQEDFRGHPLKTFFQAGRPLDLETFLEWVVCLADTLGALHDRQIIHKNVTAHTIMIHPETGRVKLTDFGISAMLTHENDDVNHPQVISGTLAYMSPEQTGRMNRRVDYRTDLYSLGVTFYECLTGHLPFDFNTPLEMIHAHMAIAPVRPETKNPRIPEIVGHIVMTLLSKNAEDRYQSGFGLKADLEACLNQLRQTGRIDGFALMTRDVSNEFIIPEKLYGRESERQTLLSVFDKDDNNAGARIIWVKGDPGIGKTALINEIHKPLVALKGHFLTGKYEELRRDQPYTGLIQAFRGLIKRILTQSDDEIEKWRADIGQALGRNGKIVTDLIPELVSIIGSQPDIPELEPEQAKNRFDFVFLRFVGVFLRAPFPIVLFLDDLQWADQASFHLIEKMMTADDIHHVSLIGAFRDIEVAAAHPLTDMMTRLGQKDMAIQSIKLDVLPEKSVIHMVADVLRRDADREVGLLGELIHMKTDGNPFFVKQFMQILYDKALLVLDDTRTWTWNMDRIRTLTVTENVAVLLADKIQALPQRIRDVLKVASCIGNRFDLELLAHLMTMPIDAMLRDLTLLVNGKLIDAYGDAYAFTHDRVREVAYAQVPEDQKSLWHYRIGVHLMSTLDEMHPETMLFDMVDQLNAGVAVVNERQDDAMRLQMIRMNLKAGKKAKLSGAYDTAFSYFNTGLTLLGKDGWATNYGLTLELHDETAETGCLVQRYEDTERLIEKTLEKARTPEDKVNSHILQIQVLSFQNNFKKAVDMAIINLRLYGVDMPDRPEDRYREIEKKYKALKKIMGEKDIRTFFLEKPIDDSKGYYPVSRVQSAASAAVYNTDKVILLLMALEGILIHARSTILKPLAACAFAGFGLVVCGVFNDIDAGYQYGRLALELSKYPSALKAKARSLHIFYAFIAHYKTHLRELLPHFKDIYQTGVANGDYQFAATAVNAGEIVRLFSGTELTEQKKHYALAVKAMAPLDQTVYLNYIRTYYQAVLNLTGSHPECRIIGDVYDETKMIPFHEKKDDKTGMSNVYFGKMWLSYLFDHYEDAVDIGKTVMVHISGSMSSVTEPQNYFYHTLSILAVLRTRAEEETDAGEREAWFSQVDTALSKMKNWADHGPMNYLHKYHLMAAEKANVLGNDNDAEKYYGLAIDGARENAYLHEEAIACERYAEYLLSRGREDAAQHTMKKAYACYARWGQRPRSPG